MEALVIRDRPLRCGHDSLFDGVRDGVSGDGTESLDGSHGQALCDLSGHSLHVFIS